MQTTNDTLVAFRASLIHLHGIPETKLGTSKIVRIQSGSIISDDLYSGISKMSL